MLVMSPMKRPNIRTGHVLAVWAVFTASRTRNVLVLSPCARYVLLVVMPGEMRLCRSDLTYLQAV